MKHFFACALFLIAAQAFAQKQSEAAFTVGATGLNLAQVAFEGDYVSNDFNKAYQLGITYKKTLVGKLSLYTGLVYTGARIDTRVLTLMFPVQSYEDFRSRFHLLSVPVYAQLDFGKYFFVRSGFLIDAQLSRPDANKYDPNNISGIGLGAALGLRYQKARYVFSVSPYLQAHGFITEFKKDKYDADLLSGGLQLAVAYQF